MNYISEINAFYDWLETNQMPKSAIALWHALMHIGNKARWQINFAVAISTIESKTGFKRSELFEARNLLQQRGRITWKPRGGNLSADYQIIPFCVHTADAKANTSRDSVRNADTSADAKAYSERTQVRTQKHTINKLNEIETKRNNSSADVPSAGIEKKESTPHWEPLKKTWIDFYKQKFSLEPTFNAAAAKNFKSILQRMQKISEQKGYDWTQEYAARCLVHFLTKAYGDAWLKENFMLNILSSKFDAIINPNSNAATKNGKEPTGGQVSSLSAFAKIDSMPG